MYTVWKITGQIVTMHKSCEKTHSGLQSLGCLFSDYFGDRKEISDKWLKLRDLIKDSVVVTEAKMWPGNLAQYAKERGINPIQLRNDCFLNKCNDRSSAHLYAVKMSIAYGRDSYGVLVGDSKNWVYEKMSLSGDVLETVQK